MEKINILIIGAGIVGLAIGQDLSQYFEDVVVVDKEPSFGRHTSSRNSEVVHSGIYYPQNSLKAKLCVEGAKLLYQFAENHHISYSKCGKMIVATSSEEENQLNMLRDNGLLNGVSEIIELNNEQIHEMEPLVKATNAIFIPSTGIIDTHSVMKQFEQNIENNDGFVIYNSEVSNLSYSNEKYLIEFTNGEKFQANFVVNAAGLLSDSISKMIGIPNQENNLQLHWCKGEYYKDSTLKGVNHLVYPVPDPQGIFLGVHLTINLNGEVRFGPNAYYTDSLNYSIDDKYKDDFFQAVNRYIDISYEKLQPDDSGIRPKLQGPKDGFRDFYIHEESAKGFPCFINLIGIESPGLTSCLAIAKHVNGVIDKDGTK